MTNSADQQQRHILDVMSTGQIRVALVGNVDAGKSTLVGTLIRGLLDDGNGSNRNLVAKHKHEIETGRTSSTVTHLMGMNIKGEAIIVPKNNIYHPEAYIAPRAHRTISLMDLAGHEKYFKTTVSGLSRSAVDYALVVVNAGQPPTHMTQKHLELCQMCGVPTIVVVTKIDSSPTEVLRQTKRRINEMIRSLSERQPYATRTVKDVETVQNKLHALVPVLQVSCVSGEGLDTLRQLLFTLPRRRLHEKKIGRPLEFLVDDIFNVTGVGIVLSGLVHAGKYNLAGGEALYLGPLKDGSFLRTNVKSLHVAQTSVSCVSAGHSACFAVSLTKAQRRLLGRKGMVILDKPGKVSKTFQAEICLTRSTPMTVVKGRNQMVAHILHMKSTVKLSDFATMDTREGSAPLVSVSRQQPADDDNVLRPGQRAIATFAFSAGPQYVRSGMRIIFRDGHIRGFGIIR